MTGWIIFASVVAVLMLVLLPRVSLLIAAGDKVTLKLRVWHLISVLLYPRPPKRVRTSQYSAKNLRRLEKKKQRKLIKEQKKQRKKSQSSPAPKPPLSEQISLIAELLKKILPKFGKYLRIDVQTIRISVGSDDAAKTALMYGAVSAGVSDLLAVLDTVTHVKTNRRSEVSVTADFLSEKTAADIRISLSITPLQVLLLAFSALWIYLRKTVFSKSPQNKTRKQKS